MKLAAVFLVYKILFSSLFNGLLYGNLGLVKAVDDF